MPTYEYVCPDGHEFERFHKMNDRTRVKCPECDRVSHRKISGGAGLHFKGTGFYITDYGKDGKGARKPSTESTGGAGEAPKAGAKSDTKPDTQSDAKSGPRSEPKAESKTSGKKADE